MAEKFSITLTPRLADMAKQLVSSGEFGSVSEVMRSGLRALERDREEHQERLAVIRESVQSAIADPRPPVPIDEAFNRIRSKLNEQFDDQ